MRIVKATTEEPIQLGRQGETGVTRVKFNLLLLIQQYGQGTAQLLVKRAGEDVVYPAVISQSDTKALWDIGAEWTDKAGRGYCELNWYVGDKLAKSEIYRTHVQKSLEGEAMDDAPDPAANYVEQVLDAAQRAEDAADRAEAAGGGGGGGGTGADGGYYKPVVTQPTAGTMQVAYTASKSGMASVAPVTVTLPAGPAGPAYELTNADKTEMVAAVLAALPNGDEVSY